MPTIDQLTAAAQALSSADEVPISQNINGTQTTGKTTLGAITTLLGSLGLLPSGLLSGTGVPGSGIGSNSWTYLNAANGDVYQKAAGTWSKIGNVQGPQGIQGNPQPVFQASALSLVGSVAAGNLVPISQNGTMVAVTLTTLLNAETIDQLPAASPAALTDTLATGQGSNVLSEQTLGGVWTLMAAQIPAWHRPVVELTTNTTLDGSVHNNRLLICSQAITLNPAITMGSGFVCDVINVSGGNVTLGAGITTSNATNILPTGESARIVSAAYSGGTINFATLSAGSGGAAPAAPGQVTGVTLGSATSSTITVSWTAPGSGGAPSAYTVNYRVTGAGSWSTATSSASGSPYTVTGLAASTSYDVQVIATNSGGSGSASSTATTSTAAAGSAPGAPTNVVAGSATSGTMTLTWGAPASGGTVSGYSAYYKLHAGSTWTLATGSLSASATTYTVTGLAAATSYDFYVAANSSGNGSTASSTVTQSTTGLSAPNVVTSLAAGTVTTNGVPLSWVAPAVDGTHGAAATYTVQYRINGSSIWVTAAAGVTTAYYTVTGLIAGQTYQFNVIAVNTAGSSGGVTTTGTPGPAQGTFTYWGTGGYPAASIVHNSTTVIAAFITNTGSIASASFGWSATQVDPPATLQAMSLFNNSPLVFGDYTANTPSSAGTFYGWMIFYDGSGNPVFAVVATTGQTMQNGSTITPAVTAT